MGWISLALQEAFPIQEEIVLEEKVPIQEEIGLEEALPIQEEIGLQKGRCHPSNVRSLKEPRQVNDSRQSSLRQSSQGQIAPRQKPHAQVVEEAMREMKIGPRSVKRTEAKKKSGK